MKGRGDRPRRLGVEPADEDGEASKRLLLGGIKQLVAPLERGAKGPVVSGRGPVGAAKFVQARFEAGE